MREIRALLLLLEVVVGDFCVVFVVGDRDDDDDDNLVDSSLFNVDSRSSFVAVFESDSICSSAL